MTQSPLLFSVACPFAIDAAYGVYILKNVFSKEESLGDDLLDEKGNTKKEFNNRVPEVFTQTKMSEKVFTKGWKFNLFNEQSKVFKQIAAISVIFSLLYFSLVGVVTKQRPLSIVSLVYSLICMFSFFNVTYVRDFDALQINFTPIALSVVSIIALQREFDYITLGLTLALVADSYFALRFKEGEDCIKYTPLENFARESWTQEAFSKNENATLQVLAACFIFFQIYLNMVNFVDGSNLSALVLGFNIFRLV